MAKSFNQKLKEFLDEHNLIITKSRYKEQINYIESDLFSRFLKLYLKDKTAANECLSEYLLCLDFYNLITEEQIIKCLGVLDGELNLNVNAIFSEEEIELKRRVLINRLELIRNPDPVEKFDITPTLIG